MRSVARQAAARRQRWNIWWALSVIFMTFALVAASLEILGVLRDIGLVVTVVSVGLSVLFGLAGASRNSVVELGEAIVTVVAEVSRSREDIQTLGTGLSRIEREVSGSREDVRALGTGLSRIERVLIDRLPPR